MTAEKSAFDRLWCSGCYTIYKRHYADDGQCPNCEDADLSETIPLWRQIISWTGTAVAAVVAVALFIGPPVGTAYILFTGGPLIETREVTMTVRGGTLFEVIPLMLLWVLVLLVTWAGATGLLPRRGLY